MARMTEFAREVVKPALEQINGVSQAEVIGGAEREILVRPDFDKLRLYGLTMEDLSTALRVANISFPGGRIRKGPLHLPLRILGEFENLDEIRQTEIPAAGPGITIGDVAEVLDTIKEPEGFTLIGDEEVVSLHLYKEVGENTIETTAEVDKVLGILQRPVPRLRLLLHLPRRRLRAGELPGPAGLAAVRRRPGLPGALLLPDGLAQPHRGRPGHSRLHHDHLRLPLLRRRGPEPDVPGRAVPGRRYAGGQLHRRAGEHQPAPEDCKRGSGEPIGDICARAAGEVASPVIAATLTTVAVFFPVIYVPGIAGEFFRDQALTVTISLLVSIFAALLLQPMLSAHILKTPRRSAAA